MVSFSLLIRFGAMIDFGNRVVKGFKWLTWLIVVIRFCKGERGDETSHIDLFSSDR